jgi:hypothetical protein
MANKVLISSIVVAVLMIAFSVFISATGNLFAKAQATPVTGHIVLYEPALPFTSADIHGVMKYGEIIFLPGGACEVVGNCSYWGVLYIAGGGGSKWSDATMRAASITNLGNYMYKVECPEVKVTYADGSVYRGLVSHVSISFKC